MPDCVAAGLFILAALWLMSRARALPEYDWQWELLTDFIITRDNHGNLEAGLLVRGLFTTLRLGFWTFCLALVAGCCAGFLATRQKLWICVPYQAVINLVRNTPPLVILFCVYFFAGNLLPVTALEENIRHLPACAQGFIGAVFAPPGQMDRMLAAVLALGAYQGAYVAEIARAGIESVPQGQWDAARALGFGRMGALWLIIIPQAFRFMLPALVGQAISTFKDSALGSLISLPDLTFQSLEVMAVSSMTFEIWISAALLYLLIGFACTIAGSWLERRSSWYY